jgi:serine/threonine protein kinase
MVTTSTINVPDGFSVQNVTLQLDISYPNDPDLTATLISPSGTRVQLFSKVGQTGSRADFRQTIFDDAASTRDGTGAPRIPKMKVLLPTYAAPEQLLGTLGPTGPWTDVYALALVLLEVLSDRPVNGAKDLSGRRSYPPSPARP